MAIDKITYRVPVINFRDFKLENHRGEDIILTYSSHTFIVSETFTEFCNDEFLGLHFNLGIRLHYEIEGHGGGTIKTNEYNLFYIPSQSYEIHTGPGHYNSFRILFPFSFLKLLEPDFEVLKVFLRSVEQKTFCTALSKNLTIDKTLRSKILELLQYKGVTFCRDTFLNSKAFEILLISLTYFESHLTVEKNLVAGVPKQSEKAKLEQARRYLETHCTEHFSFDSVADIVGMNPDKLRIAFKKLYKINMRNFILEQRLQKAMALLRDSQLPIASIARKVGYKKHSSFSVVFKRRFGYYPRNIRKGQAGGQ